MKDILNFATRKLAGAALAATTLAGVTACNEESQIGGSIAQDGVAFIVDTSFQITAKTVLSDSVISRTISQMIGCVDAPGYGLLSSNVVTQFMPAITLDTAGVKLEDVDSLKLHFTFEKTGFTGDSIAPMGIEVYPLTKTLSTPIYSNFDPTGYFDDSLKLGQTVYNLTWSSLPKAEQGTTTRTLDISLPQSLAKKLYSAYLENPASYASPTFFSENVFKGPFIKSSYGSGRILRVSKTVMNMYYHRTAPVAGATPPRATTIVGIGSYYAVTPEVISNNSISLSMAQSVKDAVAQGQQIVLARAGYDVELVFPARELIASYKSSLKGLGVINPLSMVVSALPIENKYEIAPPPNMMLILKKDKDSFFKENKLPDNKTSFYAAYNTVGQTYAFTVLRQYLLDLMDKDEITDEDVTFVLTPVNVSTETSSSDWYGNSSSYVTGVTPFVSWPAMVKIDPAKTKIRFIYTKQTIKN